MVELSRAVAVAEAEGPEAGLAIVEASRSTPTTTCTPPAASCSSGSTAPVRPAGVRAALTLVHDDAERRLLERKVAEL